MQNLASMLCWVLEHDHNSRFKQLLASIEDAALNAGYILEKPNDN
jgi:hypothetical protein